MTPFSSRAARFGGEGRREEIRADVKAYRAGQAGGRTRTGSARTE